MSEERQETIMDIIAEKRREAQEILDIKDTPRDRREALDLTEEADRIEAAAKNEREKNGNSAVMREALEDVRFYLPHFLQYMRLHCEDAEAGGYYEKILEVVNAALSAPPRNCDVGTAEEQSDRLDAFCLRHKYCSSCPCKYTEKTSCSINWSQMPYEEEKE